MDFKFDVKPFLIDLLFTFTLPSFFASLANNKSQHLIWITAAILACIIQVTAIFFLKYAYTLLHQAPQKFQDAITMQMENVKVTNAKLFLKFILALFLAATTIPLLTFIGAYVAVGCILKSIANPFVEKMAAGMDKDKS